MKTTRNIYVIKDGVAELRCGEKIILLDEDFVDIASKYQWSIGTHGYATSGAGKEQVLLHRLVIKANSTEQVDHINRNKLDNRIENLRLCNASQNMMNKEKPLASQNKYKGICLTRTGKWKAQINKNGKAIYLGLFESAELAARAYDTAAKTIHGEFANLNMTAEDIDLPQIRRRHKLSKKEVESVRTLYREGYTINEIAEIYSHSYSAIRRIIKYKTFQEGE